jgi:Neuraminidase (sialidase)
MSTRAGESDIYRTEPEKVQETGTDNGQVDDSVTLPNGYHISVVKRVEVALNPNRNFHNVSACRVPNGDFLVSHQDSLRHGGGDCFVHQWRSKDGGLTWQDEGAAVDIRQEGLDARAGEYGVTPDGRMVMIVQRVSPQRDGGNADIINNTWYVSSDSGKTWEYRGLVDPTHEKAILAPRSVFNDKGTIYFGAYSRKDGMALYVSEDDANSWRRRSVIFPQDYPDFAAGLTDKGFGPFYTHVMFLPSGGLLAMCYLKGHKREINVCYTRVSKDRGKTWGDIHRHPDLPVWAPRMNKIGEDLLVVTGRSLADNAVVAFFSTDNGKSWGNKLIIERPKNVGNCAYTHSISVGEDKLWVYSSTSANVVEMPDVVGILLERS